ncbi:unnamed protein product [Ectocarpus sp. 6 AP-2014]
MPINGLVSRDTARAMEGSLVEVGFLEELFVFGMQLVTQAGSQIHGQRVEHWWSRRRRWRLPGQHCQTLRAPAPAAVQQQQQQVVGAPVLGSGGLPGPRPALS